MRGKPSSLIWAITLTGLVLFMLSSNSAPQVSSAKPTSMWKTKKALTEQRALVEELQSSAEELEKDAEAMHREICP